MKNNIYILGLICLSFLLVATFFKVSHFSGANPLILSGLGATALVFLPWSYSRLLKSTDDKLLRFVYTAAFISFFIDFIGMVFKILHWPGANILLIIGVPLPFILFLPAYIRYHNKRKLKTDINFFAVILFMVYLGIFTSLLAIDVSQNVLDAYAHSANNITETNQYLGKQVNTKSQAKELVMQLEEIKEELIIVSNATSRQAVQENESVDYFNVPSKNMKLSYRVLVNMGLDEFNIEFENYCRKLQKSDHTNRLIDEINIYRLTDSKRKTPIICHLKLIGILNVLTDWQNKILLIEYTRSTKTKMKIDKTASIATKDTAVL